MQQLRLTPGKARSATLIVISGVFVAIGIWMGLGGEFMGWLCAGFFGLGVIVGIVNLIPGSGYLELSSDGFEVRTLYRTWRVCWADVAEFFPVRIGGNGMVGWNYVPGYKPQASGRRFSAKISGAESALPETYGRSAEDLTKLLNDWRSRCT